MNLEMLPGVCVSPADIQAGMSCKASSAIVMSGKAQDRGDPLQGRFLTWLLGGNPRKDARLP